MSEIRREGQGWNERYSLRIPAAPEVNFALRPATFALVREAARSAGVAGDY